MPNSRARIRQNGFWIHFIGTCWQVFSVYLFRAGASRLIFFASDGYADSRVCTASTSHIEEKIFVLWTQQVGDEAVRTMSAMYTKMLQMTTRHLCSVATCSRASKEREHAPHHPFIDLQRDAGKNQSFTSTVSGPLATIWTRVVFSFIYSPVFLRFYCFFACR